MHGLRAVGHRGGMVVNDQPTFTAFEGGKAVARRQALVYPPRDRRSPFTQPLAGPANCPSVAWFFQMRSGVTPSRVDCHNGNAGLVPHSDHSNRSLDLAQRPARHAAAAQYFQGTECSSVPIPRNPPNDITAYATRPLIFSIIRRLMLPMLLPCGS